jgi:hypothetical protein
MKHLRSVSPEMNDLLEGGVWEENGRYWIRTSDFYRVRIAL